MADDIESLPASPTTQSATSHLRDLVFPASFPSWHERILTSLHQCNNVLASLDTSLQALLQPECLWVKTLCVPDRLSSSPLTARQMRDVLKSQKIVSQHYLVDAILAELIVGKVLNNDLFAQLKAITVFACMALMFLKGEKAAEKDATIDEALRSVRLMASTDRRQLVATALSQVNFIQPIQSLLETIRQQREQFENNATVNIHSIAIEAVLRRLYSARLKQERIVTRESRERPKYLVESCDVNGMDEQTEVIFLRDISRRCGRLRRQSWELDEDRSLLPQTQTLLVSSQGHSLMDLEVRRWQSQSVAAVMSMRNLMLPCNAWMATDEQITRLSQALEAQFKKSANPAALWNLLQLTTGMSDDEILALPVWRTPKFKKPKHWQRISKDYGGDRNCHGILLTATQACLQRYVEVSQSRVHKGLHRLLPSVDLFLMLPLPDWVPTLLNMDNRHAMDKRQLANSLADANQVAGTHLTLRQLKTFFRMWLIRQGTDTAVSGILRGKTAQQCSPMAYSHLKTQHILAIWTAYLMALGLNLGPVLTTSVDDAVGSSLYPRHAELTALLGKYHQVMQPYCQQRSRDPAVLPSLHNSRVRHCLLILHLSTAARPVTEMYGRRSDYCLLSRFIRLEDKEGRSVSSARLVPLGKRAIAQLRVWESYLHELAATAVPALLPLSRAAQQALESSGPLFFWAEPALSSDRPIETMHVTPSNMMEQFEQLVPLAPNWHRHAVRSHLVQQQVSTHLIDALMGHEDMGGEFSHQYSNAGLSELFVLSDVLDQWHESLRLEVMAGWSIR